MRKYIQQEDYAQLLDFTKTYDQNLRKTAMGGLKTIVVDGNRATELANAVTFDLIGMNRSARSGQENQAAANRYLDQLVSDVQAFLALEISCGT